MLVRVDQAAQELSLTRTTCTGWLRSDDIRAGQELCWLGLRYPIERAEDMHTRNGPVGVASGHRVFTLASRRRLPTPLGLSSPRAVTESAEGLSFAGLSCFGFEPQVAGRCESE